MDNVLFITFQNAILKKKGQQRHTFLFHSPQLSVNIRFPFQNDLNT